MKKPDHVIDLQEDQRRYGLMKDPSLFQDQVTPESDPLPPSTFEEGLSMQELREAIASNYSQRWKAQKMVDDCDSRDQKRWSEYKKRITLGRGREERRILESYQVLDGSEEAEYWWVDYVLMPLLEAQEVYDQFYVKELTEAERKAQEVYESRVER